MIALPQRPRKGSDLGDVEPTQRRDEQGVGGVRIEGVGVRDGTHRGEERQDGRLADQWRLVGADLDRDSGGDQRPPQRRDGATPGSDQHRHLRPRHVVLEVRATKQIGNPFDLGALGVDAICIASHGRSGISRALVGSVADRLLRATRKPVLVLRPA